VRRVVRRVVLIANPAARRGGSAEPRVRAALAARACELETHWTSGPGHAAHLARALAPASLVAGDMLCVLGGDGTVVEAAGALAGTGVPIGILPGGTGNQLARLLGLPLDPARTARVLLQGAGATRTLDLGALDDGRWFALTAGVGMDAAMIGGASPAAKRRFGVAAYVRSALAAVLAARTFAVRVEADGQVYEREAGLAMIANVGAIMDGRFGLGPGVEPDDGWLDVCVLSPAGVADGVALAWRMARRDFRADPRMLFVRARHVRLTAPEGVPAQADGEMLASADLAARVVPGAACFLTAAR
jgi:diacylglycerol kinase family enzyme